MVFLPLGVEAVGLGPQSAVQQDLARARMFWGGQVGERCSGALNSILVGTGAVSFDGRISTKEGRRMMVGLMQGLE